MKIKINRSEVEVVEGSIAEELFSGLKVDEDRASFVSRLREEMRSGKTNEFIREKEMIEGLNEEISSSSSYEDPTDFLLVVGERWKANPALIPFDREVKIRSELELSFEEFKGLVRSSNLDHPIGNHKISETIKSLESMSQNTARQLGARLRRVLFSRSQSRTQYDQESGRLNSRALSQMIASPVPFNRLHKTRTEGQKVDTHVEILVDLSGSMRKGMKIQLASASCLALGDALSPLKALGLSFGVSGFTTAHKLDSNVLRAQSREISESTFGDLTSERFERTHEPLDHSIWFDSSDDWRRARARLAYMSTSYDLRNNADGEALRWMGERLSKVDSDRKILIVISDGSPALLGDNERDWVAKTRLEEVTLRESGIEVFGLGVGSNAVSSIYNNSAVIQTAKDIETVLVDKLSTWLLSEQNSNRKTRR